ncbi:TetR/AcrR family transcriptional regulator [Paenibacillus harenae]|uniref:AcrR family transcriptional regulator n=1 Tax=Paenibacillus harenae TaxID=306543 RepID=A0ABT9TZ90_PAEHA|nr:TetR/AcrR family transcriptional regulator [Paenibacillus harenae]MDQ0059220.1 AcrR family transcriptional regulator [Paenibacillus harenae]MDQ0112684.1 AcrR family transcriptional regulator [Paenibacillus harenae]
MAGSTRKEQAAETRQKLLETAKALFAEKGYHGTPVRAINRNLNMGDGILYHYFPGGKREILSVLIQESFERRFIEISTVNKNIEQLPIREALVALLRRMYELFMEDMDSARILVRESDVLEKEERDKLTGFIQSQQSFFRDFLQRRHERGEIRELNYKLAAKQFVGMGMQLILSEIIGIDFVHEPDKSSYIREMVDFTVTLWENP